MNMQKPSPEQLLVKCTQCGAWPMSVAPQDEKVPVGRITFKCPKCRAQEIHTVGVAGRLIPASTGAAR
jgi:Zn finger protein HypA/HybF involved in hydrogenase expression